jgi:hypothetical protein
MHIIIKHRAIKAFRGAKVWLHALPLSKLGVNELWSQGKGF